MIDFRINFNTKDGTKYPFQSQPQMMAINKGQIINLTRRLWERILISCNFMGLFSRRITGQVQLNVLGGWWMVL